MITLMDSHRHHQHPPITEAVLDIQVELVGDVSLEVLALVGSAVEGDYPTRHAQMHAQGELSIGPEVAMTTRQTQLGYLYVSSDDLQTFQARRNGFTFSRLRPYTQWEQFCGEARRLWEIYRAIVPIGSITRVAVRYINRLELPFTDGSLDFYDYLRTVPEISRELPQGLSSFFMQVQIPIADISGVVIINEALIPRTEPDIAPVLLDIDLFRTESVPQDEESLWNLFGELRTTKNYIFEKCITDNTRRLID